MTRPICLVCGSYVVTVAALYGGVVPLAYLGLGAMLAGCGWLAWAGARP